MFVDTLKYKMEFEGIKAYIIRLTGNETSERLAERCMHTCQEVGQVAQYWEAFDGTEGVIKYPKHAEKQDHYRWLKQMNEYLTVTEVAAILSHYSLWAECVKLDKPIVILEHDAVMVQPYNEHYAWNQINYLGCLEQYQDQKLYPFPLHASCSHNYRFICRAHAYAIDPAMARQLVAHVIRFGLSAPADMLIRADLFNIVQTGFYAYDLPEETTITGRDGEWQRNARQILATFS